MIFILLSCFAIINGFEVYMSNIPKTTNWASLQFSIKENARNWFVKRAIRSGIPWDELYQENVNNYDIIQQCKERIEDKNIKYPEYYLKPFHGYDAGNMNWKAAQEAEAATLSISSRYWDDISPMVSQEWMRNNITQNLYSYMKELNDGVMYAPRKALDIGCSIGISTEYLQDSFPKESEIYGIDLSPYFLGIAEYRSNKQKRNIHYIHANAENTNLDALSFDLIVCNFIFHELPEYAATTILKELYRILNKNGILAVIDIDPNYLDKTLNQNIFRKWAFESTEPHIYNYYQRDTEIMMQTIGLKHIEKKRNDPLNSLWLGVKGDYNYMQSNRPNKLFGSQSIQHGDDIQKNFELRSIYI